MDRPAPMRLSRLLQGWFELPAAMDRELLDIQQDSRLIRPGDVFLAVPGIARHGEAFITAAIEAGATAVIAEGEPGSAMHRGVIVVRLPGLAVLAGRLASRFFGDPSGSMQVVGVTGTNGKSSVTHFIAQLAGAVGIPGAVVGTLGWGFPGSLQDTGHTTPGAVALHRILWRLYQDGCRLVAVEVSSHALDQHRVEGVRFASAVLTNITQDHLDYHHTMTAYSEAKRRLFEWPGLQTAVLNGDDEHGMRWLQEQTPVRRVSYGLGEAAEIRATLRARNDSGTRIEVSSPQGSWSVALPLLGDFNVSNYLAAFSVLLSLGLEPDALVKATTALKSVAGRLEIVTLDGGPRVVIDYAHTPDALAKTLNALRKHCPGRLWCVFGCGGDRDPGKRSLMGEIASRLADQVVVTDDNPRSEDPDSIAQAIVAGCLPGRSMQVVRPREKAILQALLNAAPQDWVLLAGKGHETYQEIQGVKYTFSDHSMVKACWHAAVDRKLPHGLEEARVR